MIIEVLTARFQVLLDTALDGMLALGRQAALRPAASAACGRRRRRMSTASLLGTIDRLAHLLAGSRGIARALDPDPVMSEHDRVNLYELTMLLSRAAGEMPLRYHATSGQRPVAGRPKATVEETQP